MKPGDQMQSWTIRIPKEVFDWMRIKAAEETIVRKRLCSMNGLVTEIITKAMEVDLKRKGNK